MRIVHWTERYVFHCWLVAIVGIWHSRIKDLVKLEMILDDELFVNIINDATNAANYDFYRKIIYGTFTNDLDFIQQRQNDIFHFEMGYKIIARLNPQVPIWIFDIGHNPDFQKGTCASPWRG